MDLVNMVDNARKESLLAILARMGMPDVKMIEVGSYAGESAEVFASSPLVSRILCIDPWQPGYCDSDIASGSDFSAVEGAFDLVMRNNYAKIDKFKGTLGDFVDRCSFVPNFIYIDANHEYESARSDIDNALKLNPNYIGGHDYVGAWSGVVQAVDDTFKKPDVVFNDSSWLVKVR